MAVLADAYARHAPARLRRHPGATLNVAVLGDAEIARLHETFLKISGPTDALSFEDGTMDHRTGRIHLGDIAIGGEVALREASARDQPPAGELILYALHGLLHLLGFGDTDAAGRRAMFRAQDAILRRHGLLRVES